ncbi:hypothetical protein HME9304_01016 [Flagellimonas maritima]|uniref:Uncharacterized protein n=1 Tax=Flagellimonas maritima TaxID=1383885 RepID=A0A2Z4LQC8_9FLAO|nr:hypothetical protein HME9304_01016 [Allomuricauda aurantiaca]
MVLFQAILIWLNISFSIGLQLFLMLTDNKNTLRVCFLILQYFDVKKEAMLKYAHFIINQFQI